MVRNASWELYAALLGARRPGVDVEHISVLPAHAAAAAAQDYCRAAVAFVVAAVLHSGDQPFYATAVDWCCVLLSVTVH